MSELRANTISDAAGTGPVTLTGQYAAKAWFNYDQLNVVTRDSFNVSSISDDATGVLTVNYTNSFTGADYSMGGQARSNTTAHNGTLCNPSGGTFTASVMELATRKTDSVAFDSVWASGNVLGDLA